MLRRLACPRCSDDGARTKNIHETEKKQENNINEQTIWEFG